MGLKESRNMRRKPTKNTRGPNAAEKRFQAWLKEHQCAYCGKPGPSIVDHSRGATFRHSKTLIGHYFCTSKCETCDNYKTNGSHSLHYDMTGKTESDGWQELANDYMEDTGELIPDDVIAAIKDWGR